MRIWLRPLGDTQRGSALVLLLLTCWQAPLASCSPGDPDPAIQSSDTAILRWAVGQKEGVVETAFMRIQEMVVDSSGQVFVLDRGNRRITVLSPDGEVRGSFGRAGNGPGEYTNPVMIGLKGDSLWVWDQGVHRLTWLSRDGGVLGTRSFPRRPVDGTHWSRSGGYPLGPDRFLATMNINSRILATPGVKKPIGLIDSLNTVFEPILSVTLHDPPMMETKVGADGLLYGRQPFSGPDLVGVGEWGDLAFVVDQRSASSPENATFSLITFGPPEMSPSRLDIPYTPIPLSRDTVQARVEGMMGAFAESSIPMTEEEYRDALWVPEFLPPVSQVLMVNSGFWVAREEHQETGRWQFYDWMGELLIDVELPSRFQGLTGENSFLVGVDYTEMDVPFVAWYDLISHPRR